MVVFEAMAESTFEFKSGIQVAILSPAKVTAHSPKRQKSPFYRNPRAPSSDLTGNRPKLDTCLHVFLQCIEIVCTGGPIRIILKPGIGNLIIGLQRFNFSLQLIGG